MRPAAGSRPRSPRSRPHRTPPAARTRSALPRPRPRILRRSGRPPSHRARRPRDGANRPSAALRPARCCAIRDAPGTARWSKASAPDRNCRWHPPPARAAPQPAAHHGAGASAWCRRGRCARGPSHRTSGCPARLSPRRFPAPLPQAPGPVRYAARNARRSVRRRVRHHRQTPRRPAPAPAKCHRGLSAPARDPA